MSQVNRETLEVGKTYLVTVDDCCVEAQIRGMFEEHVYDEEGSLVRLRFSWGWISGGLIEELE